MKFGFFSCFFFIAVACVDIQEQNRKLVEDYLNEHYSVLAPFSVDEVSKADSLYSPFLELASLSIQYSELELAATKAVGQINNSKSRREFELVRNKLLSELQSKYDTLSMYQRDILFPLDHPELSSDKNRLGIKARYSASGESNVGYFYFNIDGKTIGHTSMENYTSFKKVVDAQSRCRSSIFEIKIMQWKPL